MSASQKSREADPCNAPVPEHAEMLAYVEAVRASCPAAPVGIAS